MLILLFALVGVILLFLALQGLSRPVRKLSQGLFISYFTFALLFGVGEIYFRYFHAQSTGFYSLTFTNWLERYWETNEAEFRDGEWVVARFEGKRIVAVVGDSVTAGHGINDSADRYSNILAERLGEDYVVVNLGELGTSTTQQMENLQLFTQETGFVPDIVIWQYLLNDIEYAAFRLSMALPLPRTPQIVNQSYLLNYLYFKLSPPQIDYWGWHYAQYDNSAVWAVHQQELEEMVDYIDGLDAELITFILPNILDPIRSIEYVDRVAQALEAMGETQIMKLYAPVAGWSKDVPLIVSHQDTHPSVEFNEWLGNTLYSEYFLNREDER